VSFVVFRSPQQRGIVLYIKTGSPGRMTNIRHHQSSKKQISRQDDTHDNQNLSQNVASAGETRQK